MTGILRAFRTELYKLFRQKRTYLAILGMNLLSMLVLVFGIVARIWALMSGAGFNLATYLAMGDTWVRDLVSVQLIFMTIFSGLFLSLIWGEMVSKEFRDQTIRLSLMGPVSRLQLFAAKTSVAFLLMVVTIAVSMIFIFISLLLIHIGGKGISGAIEIMSAAFTGRELLLFGGLNFFTMSFIGMVAAFSSGIETAIGLSAFTWMIMSFMDGLIGALNRTGDISGSLYEILRMSFTNSAHEILIRFSKTSGLVTDLTIYGSELRALGVYSLIFLLLAAFLFCRREVQ
ncbi:MAG: hypothetical protein CVV64_07985 [Candidatus Wallbacteria bacterium HGW-Wallbacteria-1]|jgi:ABC-type transport system involved in multi-copper enzyme maturation permease subunit|uniref:Uncharacterized protein n=1 Tax=Candidatus Wallbacteria bacterium HGW-Wallbacteria-1 TaxID=2013854 RepID=A0A2N1PR41_9BACT|nr:MAG: hypothetical protein CVV64_07985 [Candidatus Wallbacteria bacterium HGW-Wallbacteria-1]